MGREKESGRVEFVIVTEDSHWGVWVLEWMAM